MGLTASVVGVDAPGMGFILFHEGGRAKTLEGFRYGDVDTRLLDFAEVSFFLSPEAVRGYEPR